MEYGAVSETHFGNSDEVLLDFSHNLLCLSCAMDQRERSNCVMGWYGKEVLKRIRLLAG